MSNNPTFKSALFDLCAPDLFNVALSAEEVDQIYDKVVANTKKTYVFPNTYLEWRDAAYDAMEELGYELSPEY